MQLKKFVLISTISLLSCVTLYANSVFERSKIRTSLNGNTLTNCRVYTSEHGDEIYIPTKSLADSLNLKEFNLRGVTINEEPYLELNKLTELVPLQFTFVEDTLELTYDMTKTLETRNTYTMTTNINNGISLNITDNTLNFKMKLFSTPEVYEVIVYDANDNVIEDTLFRNVKCETEGLITGNIRLPNLKDGIYKVVIYVKDTKEGNKLYSYFSPINLRVVNRYSELRLGDTYCHNKRQMERFNKLNPSDYTVYKGQVGYENKMRELANSITVGVDTDYNKAKAIYKWVCNNMWYDTYKYQTNDGSYKGMQPLGTILKTKKGLCTDYSLLYSELLKSLGIPCFIVQGFADSTNRTPEFSMEAPLDVNHAWNLAFVDGRWINVDTTYGSLNKDFKGDKKTLPINTYLYFDMSIEGLSYTHKIIDIYEPRNQN